MLMATNEVLFIKYIVINNDYFDLFQVPVHKFHELRYSVAYVLKEMEDLEKRSILRIQD